MIDERELISRAVEVQAPPEPSFERLLSRRDRKRRNQRIRAGVLGVAIAIAVGWLGVNAIRSTAPVPADPPDDRSVDLGIFEPVAGRIVYSGDFGLWAVDPSAPSPSTLVHLSAEEGSPIEWSSDGTQLLLVRRDPTDQTFPYDDHLYILHADGAETRVTPEPVDAAAISSDGSKVVYSSATSDGLFVVDAEGGQPALVAEVGEEPTFSPDGTQIAYLGLPRRGGQVQAGREHVWVANADGTDAHEILTDEPALEQGVFGLTWSPAGNRIAMENTLGGHIAIYTFAPDGSDFTKVVTGGFNPYWSPDGSRIAYMLPYGRPRAAGAPLAIANADGSNAQVFNFGGVGPWHPGGSAIDETAPTPDNTERFDSRLHGITIDHPAGWTVRPATEPWGHGEVAFGSPDVDVIFDPTLRNDLYLAMVSRPLGGRSGLGWVQGHLPPSWGICKRAFGAGGGGGDPVDGAYAWIEGCDTPIGSDSVAIVATATRGYVIYLHVGDEVPATYRVPDFEAALETVDLHPDEALDASSSSPSP